MSDGINRMVKALLLITYQKVFIGCRRQEAGLFIWWLSGVSCEGVGEGGREEGGRGGEEDQSFAAEILSNGGIDSPPTSLPLSHLFPSQSLPLLTSLTCSLTFSLPLPLPSPSPPPPQLLYEQQLSSLREQLETYQHTSRERQKTEITGSDEVLRGERGGKGRGEEVIREREQLLSPVHMEDGVEDLIKENTALKQQLSSVQLEADHQRVKLQSQLAEAQASARTTSEEAAEMVRTPHKHL